MHVPLVDVGWNKYMYNQLSAYTNRGLFRKKKTDLVKMGLINEKKNFKKIRKNAFFNVEKGL
jgi:hypothetical protein